VRLCGVFIATPPALDKLIYDLGMRLLERFLPLLLILSGLSVSAAGQTVAENAGSLRQQVADVQAREEQLRAHLSINSMKRWKWCSAS
jgi:hypothetical protein